MSEAYMLLDAPKVRRANLTASVPPGHIIWSDRSSSADSGMRFRYDEPFTTETIPLIGLNLPEAAPDRTSRIHNELKALRNLPDNWDSYGASRPNATALANAEDVLLALQAANLLPNAVAPCADDGVTFVLAKGKRSILIECFNTGEIVLSQSSGPADVTAFGVDPEELNGAIEGIGVYLS